MTIEPADQWRLRPRQDGEAEARELAELRLSHSMCHQVLGASLDECLRAPKRGSLGGPGIYAYEGGLAEFTVQLESVGYERENLLNLPIMISDELGKAIVFTSGSRLTGVQGSRISPSTKYKKGGVAHLAIINNQPPGQGVLGEALSFASLPAGNSSAYERIAARLDGVTVYLYMAYYDWPAGEIRSEVSLPAGKQGTQYIDKWLSRTPVLPFEIGDRSHHGLEDEIDFDIEPL